MKNKLLIALLLLFVGFLGNAQTPTFIRAQSFQASGVGGPPTMNVNVPAGQNRLMVIHMFIERNHSPANSNWPFAPDGSGGLQGDGGDYFPYVNGIQSIYRANRTLRMSVNNTNYSTNQLVFYLRDVDGLTTGNNIITLPGYNPAERPSDDIAVNVMVFSNVKDLSEEVAYGSANNDGTTDSTLPTVGSSHISIPVGRTISDILYVGLGGSSQQSTVTIPGWTTPPAAPVVVNNTSGPDFHSPANGEPDGMAITAAYRTYSTTATAPSFNLTRNNSSGIRRMYGYIYGLIPLAKVGINGIVYRDNNGLPVNAGGTGGAVYNSSANGNLYVNVLDATGTTVIATAQVNNSGVYNIPEGGDLMEGTTYVLQLSRNQGVVGQPAPAKQLHTNWLTVGESLFASGTSDGNPNGLLTITLGDTNSTTTRFGVNICTPPAITSQPTGANYCQNATTTALSVTATGATSYQWYRNPANSTTGGTPVGTNSSTYTPVTTATGTFYYYVVVGNGTCSVTSNTATVNVVAGPAITTQPSGANYCQNATATALSVTATGATSYQWYRNTSNSTSGGTAVGTNSATYTPVTTATGIFYYYVVVGNGSCSVTSNIVAVSVTATPATPVPSAFLLSNTCPDTTANLTTIQPAAVSGQTYEWHTTATNPNTGTLVANPGVVSNGTYYLYSKTNSGNCYSNASNAVTVTINTCGTCTEPGDFGQNGNPTKVGITVQPKQDGWPTNIPNGFIALQSKSKGMVITRVESVGGGTNGAPNLATDSVKDPKEGMLVYDLNSDCVKLFNGTVWNCISNICDSTN